MTPAEIEAIFARARQLQGQGVKTIYVSGPMTGLPDSNYPAFNVSARWLRTLGFNVLNPADSPVGHSRAHYMRQDFPMVAKSDALYMLDGWEKSEGANDEIYAGLKCGCRFFDKSLAELVMYGPTRLYFNATPRKDEP